MFASWTALRYFQAFIQGLKPGALYIQTTRSTICELLLRSLQLRTTLILLVILLPFYWLYTYSTDYSLIQPNALLLTFRLLFCSLHQSIHNSDSCHFMCMRSSITTCVCAKMRVRIILLLIAFGWATGKLLIKEFVYLKRKPDLEYLVVNQWGSRALLLLSYALTVHSPSSHVNL